MTNPTSPIATTVPTREEVLQALAPHRWAEKYADIGLVPDTKNAEFLCAAKTIFAMLDVLSADHARLGEENERLRRDLADLSAGRTFAHY
jgi:hypothetical protein